MFLSTVSRPFLRLLARIVAIVGIVFAAVPLLGKK